MTLLWIIKAEVMHRVDSVLIVVIQIIVDKWSIPVREENFLYLLLQFKRAEHPLSNLNVKIKDFMVLTQIHRRLRSILEESEMSATMITKKRSTQPT